MNKFLALIAFISSTACFASTYQCSFENEDQYAEYTVEFNLANGKAAFFDNDNWSIVQQKQTVGGSYVFEGKDNYGDPLKIEVQAGAKQGYARFRTNNRTVFEKISCKAIARKDLLSNI